MKMLSLVIKILILVALIAVGFLIYVTCAGTPLIQKIDKSLPDSAAAPFEIPTKTKVYLAQKAILNEDESVTMHGWYERDSDKWVLHEGSVTLPKVLRPYINKR